MPPETRNDKPYRPLPSRAPRPSRPGRSDMQRKAQRAISAGTVVYRATPDGIKFLILYHRGAYWNFAKGSIESEERAYEAALRETEEETGLKASQLEIAPHFKAYERFYFRQAGQLIYKIVIFYLAKTESEDVRISSEHNGYGWFLFNDARKILGKYKDSQKVLRQAYEFIRKQSSLNRQKDTSR